MARFKVYSASAGAGKTYSLVRNFLKICLAEDSPQRFMRVLAITFTNKAANEMKERIVLKLKELRDYQKTGELPDMMDDLCQNLSISREKLSHRAGNSLKAILHQYSAFSVSTIDKFTNRLIRSFARDLKLNSNYEVELDSDSMLSEAIDQMMAQLEEDTLTTRFLLRFVSESLEEGRSPRPEIRLQEMGRNLFKEEAFEHIKKLRHLPQQELLEVISSLSREKGQIEARIHQSGRELLEFIHHCGLDPECFSGKHVYNYIHYIATRQTHKWSPGKTVLKAVEGGPFYAKSKAKKLAPLFDPVEDELRQQLTELVQMIVEAQPKHHLVSLVLQNVYTLAVLTEMDQQLQEVKDRSNRLPIGEFNKLISEKLEQEPADYLFEKLGERYQHFFIDEFQDTSRLQWRNLLPLVNNAMSAGGSSMIVGDGKQSIYRWRGGEVSQFISLSNNSDPSNKVEVNDQLIELYERETINLPHNWRSRKNIVEFNNEFFKMAAGLLLGEDFQDLYKNGSHQLVQKGEGGHVQLKLLPFEQGNREAYALEQCAECFEIIRDAQSRNYPLNDICILVRNNSHGAILAEYLLQHDVPVISPDSLAISQSTQVKALISFLGSMAYPANYALRYDFLKLLFEKPAVQETYPDQHRFLDEHIRLEADKLAQALTGFIPGFDAEKFQLMSLPDKLYHLMEALQMDIQQNPFLHAFLDQVQAFSQKQGEDLAGFMRWWEEKGSGENLALPETANAIKVMSIHKSKGLQFGLCILAFADWKATSENGPSRAWLNLEGEDWLGLPSAYVSLSDPHEQAVVDGYRQIYEQNKSLVYFDNLNLLYVAFTRAVDELYVLGGEGLFQQNGRVYRYLSHYLKEKGEETEFCIGEKILLPPQEKPTEPQNLLKFSRSSWQNRLKVAATAPLNWQGGELSGDIAWGKKLHSLLAETEHAEDIERVWEINKNQGNFLAGEETTLREVLKEIVHHPEMAIYFSKDAQVLNEMEILDPQGTSARPDRVVIYDNTAHLIDYKTGREESRHFKQLEQYRLLLSDMGYEQGENILLYIGNSLKIKRWHS